VLPNLDSVRLKLRRAYKQIEALKGEIDLFMDRRPYEPAFNFNSVSRATGQFITEITVRMLVKEPCPAPWGIIIGEIVHDIRSALDHLVYQLVIYATDKPPSDDSRTQFPIYDVAGNFQKHRGSMLMGVDAHAADLIKSFQPFSTGESADSPLWHLNQLSNIDKHRTIHLAGGSLEAFEVSFPALANRARILSKTVRAPGPFEHNTIIGEIRILSAGPLYERDEVEMHPNLTFQIVFDERTRAIAGRPVIGSLTEIADRVRDCIASIGRDVLFVDLVI
jgi:hypothetical protein